MCSYLCGIIDVGMWVCAYTVAMYPCVICVTVGVTLKCVRRVHAVCCGQHLATDLAILSQSIFVSNA